MGVVTGGAGLVAGRDRRRVAVAGEQLADGLGGVGDHPLVERDRVGAQHRHGDRVLVHVKPDVGKLFAWSVPPSVGAAGAFPLLPGET